MIFITVLSFVGLYSTSYLVIRNQGLINVNHGGMLDSHGIPGPMRVGFGRRSDRIGAIAFAFFKPIMGIEKKVREDTELFMSDAEKEQLMKQTAAILEEWYSDRDHTDGTDSK